MFAIITGIPSGSLCGGERRGAPERETRNDWGCGRSGLALFAGSHRSPLEKNGSLDPTLCQGVAVPSAFFVFSPGGKGTVTYAKLPSFYASIVSFYANPNTDISQWSKQFYLQCRFFMNMYFGAFWFFKWQGWSIDSNSFGSLPSLEVCPDIILISRIVKKVLRLGVSQSRCTQVFFERGLLPCPTIDERVSLVDTTKVDSLLLISQSPLAVEDLNKSIAVLLPTPYDGYVTWCYNTNQIWHVCNILLDVIRY